MISRRKKIIFISIIVILILAVVWFLYQKSQQSKNVQSGTGNVSSLFPFTGTNTTDFQKEPNSGLPQKDGSGNGNGNGSNNGNGTGSGNGNGNGIGGNNGLGGNNSGNILNLNDLTVGTGGFDLGIPTGGGGSGSGGNGGGGGSCNGTDCNGNGCNTSECMFPNAGQISLTANGSVYTNLTSDGGNVALVWIVAQGQPVNTTCTASSSKGDWVGTKSSSGGTDTLTIPANTGTTVLSRTYAINCTNIGQASVTVNIPPVSYTDFIPGSSLTFTVNRQQSADLPTTGGSARFDWSVNLPRSTGIGRVYLPSDYTAMGITCTAQSSASDLVGPERPVGGATIIEPANNTDTTISKTYTINCTRIGQVTVTVNIDSLLNGDQIKGSSISITADGGSYSNLSNDGGVSKLAWKVTLPASYNDIPVIVCTAQSSAGDWVGTKAKVGTDNVTLPQNTGSDIISNTYTISCTHVGDATATVNVGPLNKKMTGVINGSVNLTVDGSSSSLVDAAGGTANLAWTIDTGGKSDISCAAQSSAGDWIGAKAATSGTEMITLPPNTGTSTLIQTYTMNCDTLGSATVVVNINISGDAFADRTPEFLFTANGGTNVTVAPGTPVELDWQTRNINGNSCVATSDGSYAGWGTEYILSSDALSAKDQADLATYQGQLTADQNQLALLTATSTGSQTLSLADIQGQIATNQTLLSTTVSNISGTISNISTTNTTLQTASSTVSNISTQLNQQKNILNLLNSHQNDIATQQALTGLVLNATDISSMGTDETNSDISIVSNTITTLQTQLNTASNTKNTLAGQLTTQQSTLSTLTGQKQQLQNQIANLQTQYNQAQTNAQISQDLTVAQQIKNLQYQIQVLQGKIGDINAKVGAMHLAVKSRGKTVKKPFVDVGPTSESYSEIAGLENVVVTGTDGGKKISGGDGSGGGIIGDVPITTNRTYTLKCSGLNGEVLNPQSVTITVDNSQGNQTTQLSTDPALTFLVNGQTSADVNVGDSVKLTWEVANLPANSCRATSDGTYSGWGASYQKVMHIRTANGTIIDNTSGYTRKPGDFIFYTNDLLADPGGSLKAPKSNVGTNPQTFTETIGADNSITATRTYTLTCGNIPPQTVTINVSNNPTLTLQVDGVSAENVPPGSTAVLTWTAQNIKGGSCRGTSNGNTDPASGGSFDGWGASYQATTTTLYTASGKFNQPPVSRLTLISVPGGTLKAPTTDVNSISKIFTETIGQDGSITTSERTYTITCTGLDGSMLTQTIDINGPVTSGSSGSNGGDGTLGLASASDPCASDMDINMAKINLQNFITTYKSITGNDINPSPEAFDSNGNPIEFDKQGNRINLTHDDSATDSIDSCVSDLDKATNDPTNPNSYKGPMGFIPYNQDLFNVGSSSDMDALPAAVNRSNYLPYGRSPSFLPDWVWVDQDSLLHPDHDGVKYSGATWTWDDTTGIATACKNGGTPGAGPASCTYGDSNFVGYGIYVGDLVDLAHIAYDGDGGGGCPKGKACVYTRYDFPNKGYDGNGSQAFPAYGDGRANHDKIGAPEIYTGSDGNQTQIGLGFCFGVGAFDRGSGGYPLINGNGPSYPAPSYPVWNQANNAGVTGDVKYGEIAIYEGDCDKDKGGQLQVFYTNDDLGLWGAGIGVQIEKNAGFY